MSPPPLAAPIARRLSISASAVGEEGLFSCVLPEELVVEIIADRVQVVRTIGFTYQLEVANCTDFSATAITGEFVLILCYLLFVCYCISIFLLI